jgi:LGFP repeat
MAQDGTLGAADASGSQGVQVGSGNVQNNYYRPLDHSFLITLSPYKAVARLRQMPHDDAVYALASAPLDDVAEVLKVMLSSDEALAVALLADLNPRTAERLIRLLPTPAERGPLEGLLNAAARIARRATELKWDHDERPGNLEHVAEAPNNPGGYFRNYAAGQICYGELGIAASCCAISGPIAEAYAASGGPGGVLGFPLSEARTDGTRQPFANGSIMSSQHGAYVVLEPIFARYDSLSREFGIGWLWLGFPVADREEYEGFTLQRFEGGAIYSSEAGTFAVRSEVVERASRYACIPISAEEALETRPTGRVQRFKGADGTAMAVYSSDNTGTHEVVGRMLAFYEGLGGAASWLGLPAEAETDHDQHWAQMGRIYAKHIYRFQRFERGSLLRLWDNDPVALRAETVELVVNHQLGWPLSQEKPIDGSHDETIQYFGDGIVTLQDGQRRAWRRLTPLEGQDAPLPDPVEQEDALAESADRESPALGVIDRRAAAPQATEPHTRASGWGTFPR